MFMASNAFLTSCVVQQADVAFALGNMLRSPAAAVAAAVLTPSSAKAELDLLLSRPRALESDWGWVYAAGFAYTVPTMETREVG